MTVAAILQNHYVLAVHDVKKSAEYYVKALGFHVVMEPPGWVFVSRDNVMVMLGECPDDRTAEELNNHSYFGYLRVDDADTFRAGVLAAGYPIHSEIGDKPWGMREFAVKTPDGHRITIGNVIGRK